jgi:hypothetical protein
MRHHDIAILYCQHVHVPSDVTGSVSGAGKGAPRVAEVFQQLRPDVAGPAGSEPTTVENRNPAPK